jgi:hypothetical protein
MTVLKIAYRTAITKCSVFRNGVAAAALSLALTVPNMAAAAVCVVPAQENALQVRMLQNELMVAALTCNQKAAYNGFVMRFKPQLSTEGKHLQSFFSQQYGSRSTKELNGFITRIANESSRRGMVQRGAFCRQAENIHSGSVNLNPAGLASYAKQFSFAGNHGFALCPTTVAASQAPSKPVKIANP